MATLVELLNSPNQSVRLKAALAAGTYPNPDQIEILISQCASESDFFVRDTLSWALMRHDQKSVVEHFQLFTIEAFNAVKVMINEIILREKMIMIFREFSFQNHCFVQWRHLQKNVIIMYMGV